MAYFHTELARDGPGLLLRDLQRGKDDDIAAVTEIIKQIQPDILVLQGIDWDLNGDALAAFQAILKANKTPLPHSFAAKPNRGVPSGLDLNGNDRRGDAQDAIGYGRFTGQNGLAVLSRHPIARPDVQDFTAMLWSDLPGALLPYPGQPEGLTQTLPLSSTAHWLVPIDTATQGRVWIGAFAATTPVFDGPEDRNGRRNHDEVRFWSLLLNGTLTRSAPDGFVLAGNTNLDPERGDGRRAAILDLLAHPRLQDPAPMVQGDTATVDFGAESAGKLRVTYVLPDQTWRILDTGLRGADTLRHDLVWVDIERR